jgi:NAD-dependent dihydropyrimidine dehydrogenase PreA subunit
MNDSLRQNTLRYDSEKCVGCGTCTLVCPHAVFSRNERVVEPLHAESCMECGACQLNCPGGAITVDSGVGCAAAMMRDALLGRKETAGCSC